MHDNWISVLDVMPAPGQTVLTLAHYAYDDSDKIEVVTFNPEMYEPIWSMITHWMPLPKLPDGTGGQPMDSRKVIAINTIHRALGRIEGITSACGDDIKKLLKETVNMIDKVLSEDML